MEDLPNARIAPADKKGRLSYLLKYQLIHRISIILYRYTYRIEKIDRYSAPGIFLPFQNWDPGPMILGKIARKSVKLGK